ncbi:hypothetical protein AB1N83_013199 [Pleurotus pulmonarius]|nr:hypothetical protein EYR38_010699 [Pleurotus pulmonarius]
MPDTLKGGIQTALMAVRQTADLASFNLMYLSWATLGNAVGIGSARVALIQRPPGSVEEGLSIYERKVALAYSYCHLDTDRSETILQIMKAPVVLEEFGRSFDEARSKLINRGVKNPSIVPTDPIQAAAAMFALISYYSRARLNDDQDVVLGIVAPIVTTVYNALLTTAREYTSLSNISLGSGAMCADVPAASRLYVPAANKKRKSEGDAPNGRGGPRRRTSSQPTLAGLITQD